MAPQPVPGAALGPVGGPTLLVLKHLNSSCKGHSLNIFKCRLNVFPFLPAYPDYFDIY